MILKEYIKYLQKLAEKHGDAEVWYATDEEGNSYDAVVFGPSVVYIPENTTTSLESEEVREEQEEGFTKEIIVLN